jgi:hypothetical protein
MQSSQFTSFSTSSANNPFLCGESVLKYHNEAKTEQKSSFLMMGKIFHVIAGKAVCPCFQGPSILPSMVLKTL